MASKEDVTGSIAFAWRNRPQKGRTNCFGVHGDTAKSREGV